MSDNKIFSKYAEKYYAAGLPVIPLCISSKRPVGDALGWSRYHEEMVSVTFQHKWQALYHQNNIGLPLGKQSGVVMIDIDSVSEEVNRAILSVLPKSPWIRIGAKGQVMAYRFNGEKARKIMANDGKMLVEILSSRNYVVLPPSIHPDTGKPYYANCELLDVLHLLPLLPVDVEDVLRSSLSKVVNIGSYGAGSTKFDMSSIAKTGTRDVQMTKLAGFLSNRILDSTTTLSQALDDMVVWCNEKAQSVSGDPIDISKGLSKVLEFLHSDVRRGKKLPPGWDINLTDPQKELWNLKFEDDQKEWTSSEFTKYIEQRFAEIESPTDPERYVVIDFVIEKMSYSKNLSNLEIAVIIEQLKRHSKLKIPSNTFLRAYKENQRGGMIAGENHTEIALATIDLFRERRGGQLAYWGNKFWEWIGNSWSELNIQELLKIVSENFGATTMGKKASDHVGVVKVIQNNVPQELTKYPGEGVNFRNGYLTTDLKLIEHNSEQGMTYCLPYNYRPELAGRFPKFQEYLTDSWGHHTDFEDKMKALQQAMAMTLFGQATKMQRAFFLYGVGGTGKSVILDIIDELVPAESRCAIAPHRWTDRFVCAEFMGKLLNRAGELDDKLKINGQTFKSIISGEPMQAEFKGTNLFKFSPRTAHWFASNSLPKSTDISSGFNRRWLILNFDKIITPDKRILDLGRVIAQDEMEAISAWAVEALPELIAKGEYTLPSSHYYHLENMSLSNSTIRQWASVNLNFKDKNKTLEFKEIFNDYWAYCAMNGIGKAMNPSEFKAKFEQVLEESGQLKKESSESSLYLGIKIVSLF